MPSCVIRFCKNYTTKTNKASGVTFHRFPKDELQEQKWIEFVRLERSEIDWMPNTHSRICSDHFGKEKFYMTRKGLRKLNKDALPYEKAGKMKERDTIPIIDIPLGSDQPLSNAQQKIDLKQEMPYNFDHVIIKQEPEFETHENNAAESVEVDVNVVPVEFDCKNDPIKLEPADREEDTELNDFDLYERHEVKVELTIVPEVLEQPDPPAAEQICSDNTNNCLQSSFQSAGQPSSSNNSEKRFPEEYHSITYSRSIRKKPFTCATCDKSFTRKSNLTCHLRIHEGVKPFSCHICNRSFTLKSTLVNHLRVHSDVKPFSCHICDKVFKVKLRLSYHLYEHSENPHSCYICKKGFRNDTKLACHLRFHSVDKKFYCHICQKGFTEKTGLTYHMKVHTDEKPFSCEICKKGFRDNSNLTSHLRVHTGERKFYCDICKKGFKEKSGLTYHLKIHSGEKPFSCQICKKGFRDNSNLTSHLRIHSGDKPYCCDICKKCFKEKSSLTRHQRSHIDEVPLQLQAIKMAPKLRIFSKYKNVGESKERNQAFTDKEYFVEVDQNVIQN